MMVGHPTGQNSPQDGSPSPRLDAHQPFIAELYQRSGCASYSLSLPDLTTVLSEIVNAQVPAEAPASAVRDCLQNLRIEELVLARACAAGSEKAWDVFLIKYREGLYAAALSIAHDDRIAHDLADSLYADLFGTEATEGRRLSKLNSYSGMGSLLGWLRTILAHTFIDRYRSERPVVSLTSEDDDEQFDVPAPPPPADQTVDPRVEAATDEALQSLDPEDRYLLASYFLHGRTLAEIGRTLGLHESTVKRRIDKLTGTVRKQINRSLTRRGMSRAEAEEALSIDIRDLQLDVRSRMEENTQDFPGSPSLGQKTKSATTVGSGTTGQSTGEK
jgi:RNA polymerase sigma-70 factor (ECF subfamily)